MSNTGSITIEPSRGLRGAVRVPADKSITHRALFFGAINCATTTILDPSPALDCRSTIGVLAALGRDIEERPGAIVLHDGEASNDAAPLALDCGNSGTTARLSMGLLAAEPGVFTLDGDASLRRRPMERIVGPLRRLGAAIESTSGTLPARILGTSHLVGGDSHGLIAVESAQVHAALVLAALRSRAGATLFQVRPMRDHTIRILRAFGCEPLASSAGVHRILPSQLARDVTIAVPGDFSSAAFFITAAVIVPDAEIIIDGVGLNPTRIALVRALQRMGADISVEVISADVEPRGRIVARYAGPLTAARFGVGDDPEAPIGEMIDELPLLALAATQAQGTTVISGAEELRVKESDRIATTAAVLRALGAIVTEAPDGLTISGPQTLAGGASVDHGGDHRLAMMAAVGALIAGAPTTIVDPDVAAVSYPSYWSDLEALGGTMHRI